MAAYNIGDPLPFGITIRNSSGVLANATTVTVTIALPDGTSVGPFTVAPTTTGTYSYPYTGAAGGRYVAYWVATGTNAGAESQAFVVADSYPVVTLDEIRAHLSLTSTADDTELQVFVDNAVVVVEGLAGPIIPRTITGETHDGGAVHIWTDFAPIISVTSLTEMYGYTQFTLTAQTIGQASDNYGYTIDDVREGRITRRGVANVALPFGLVASAQQRTGFGTVVVSYTAGRAQPSASIRFAVKELVRYSWRQVHGGSATFQDGQFVSTAATVGVSEAMVARLKMILGPEAIRPFGIY